MKKNSAKFRQMQRERIMRTKPWEKSTGAKTPYGKERSKMNALKMSPHLYSLIKELNEIIKQNKSVRHKVSILLIG
ncbi:hypothetical protein [Sulfuricurvum sp.]|uniref:hypothetical protein n=1 Tax=Sulfuricurvum sp. TaxID=2025608 RepID=UPI0026337D03|nr:hypothetical protein [Sulfuricurvum sp.]MDD2265774.1 hypothetical protein [Sulfuricurvum sp.]